MLASSLITLAVQRVIRQYVQRPKQAPRRIGGAIRLRSDMYERYTQLHDLIWPEVLRRLRESNIRNFSIYHHRETSTLFSHFEWIGAWKYPHLTQKQLDQKFQADMNAIAADEATREWWALCEPCQEPFADTWPTGERPPSQQNPNSPVHGDWWAPLTCVAFAGHWPTEYSCEMRDPEFIPQNSYGQTSTRANPPEPLLMQAKIVDQ